MCGIFILARTFFHSTARRIMAMRLFCFTCREVAASINRFVRSMHRSLRPVARRWFSRTSTTASSVPTTSRWASRACPASPTTTKQKTTNVCVCPRPPSPSHTTTHPHPYNCEVHIIEIDIFAVARLPMPTNESRATEKHTGSKR
jgi:hypothetical protein